MASQSTAPRQGKPYRIAIIGGGIGGLYAALSIHYHCSQPNLKNDIEIEINVYEQAAEYKEIGAGVGLAANATRLIEKIGLYDECRAIAGSRTNIWISFRRYDNSEEIHSQKLDPSISQKQLPMHRAEFLDVLVHAIQKRGAATLHTNKKCVSLNDLGDLAEVTFADGTHATANLVIAADGIHSAVRSHFVGDTPQFGNMVVYRGLCPISALEKWWPYDFYSIAWIAPGKHFLIFPISKNKTLNIVAFVTTKKEDLGETAESWTMAGDKADVEREFKDFDTPIRRIIENMNTNPNKWILYDRQPFEKWVFAGGKVALLGDAAHAMLPHQGAGAGQAIEDGYILGRVLQDFLTSRASDTSHSQEYWLDLYQSVRLPRAQKVQITSRDAGEIYEMQREELKGRPYEECVPIARKMMQDRMTWIWTEDIDQAYEKARERG